MSIPCNSLISLERHFSGSSRIVTGNVHLIDIATTIKNTTRIKAVLPELQQLKLYRNNLLYITVLGTPRRMLMVRYYATGTQ